MDALENVVKEWETSDKVIYSEARGAAREAMKAYKAEE